MEGAVGRVLLLVTPLHAQGVTGNLFAATSPNFYVNPAIQAELNSSIATAHGAALKNLEASLHVPSAYWIDKKAKVAFHGFEAPVVTSLGFQCCTVSNARVFVHR